MVRVLNWIAKTTSWACSTGNILKPPVAACPSMSMLSRLLTALEQTKGADAASLHSGADGSPSNGLFERAAHLSSIGGLGGCLQLYVEGDRALLLDGVGDGRLLRMEGSPGHYGRWRHAIERHRPLIGRVHEVVA